MSHTLDSMLMLRGVAGTYDGRYWPRGAMYEAPACEYAKRRGYIPNVLDVAGATGPGSAQTRLALATFRADETVTAIYGFSGGGFNIFWFLSALTPAERSRVRLVVVLGVERAEHDYHASQFAGGAWELVYRKNPPGGHMDGPRALLAAWDSSHAADA